MSGLFAFLLFLSLLSIPIGLIKPSLFNKLFKKDMTRKKLTILFAITSFILFIAFGFTVDSTVDVQNDQIALKENNEPNNIQKEPAEEVNEITEPIIESDPIIEDKKDNEELPAPPEEELNNEEIDQPTEPTQQTNRENVLIILKKNAEKEWGDDYQMVKFEYDNQVEAYDWVVSQTEYPDIMTNAKQEWGDDYQMVQFEYENQVEAYEWIMAQTEYPDIMTNAKQEWGDDYQMVQFEYENQVEAYDSL
jgi:hypothetical protein